MSKEYITAMSAAQRLSLSVAEVEKLYRDKALKGKKEFAQLYIEKESMYAYSGIKEQGKQTASSKAGRKPNVMSFEEATSHLGIDMTALKSIIQSGEIDVVDGAGGIRGPKKAQVEMYKIQMSKDENVVSQTEEKNTNTKNGNNQKTHKATVPNKKQEALHSHKIPTDKCEETLDDQTTDKPDSKSTTRATDDTCAKETPPDDNQTSFDDDKRGLENEWSLDKVMQELFKGSGLKLMSKEQREEALQLCTKQVPTYTHKEVKEVVDISYKMGKLAVYESMDEFKRKGVIG